MRIRDILLIIFGTLTLMGCPCTCRNEIKVITFENETNDSLCISLGDHYPSFLDTVPPFSKYYRPGVYTDDIEYDDFRAFVATLGTVKKYGMDSVLECMIYDTIIHLSLNELETWDYVVRYKGPRIDQGTVLKTFGMSD